MQTTKTNTLYNFREVLDLYPHEDTADVLATELATVLRYYKEGDDYHRKHFEPLDKEEYGENIAFLKSFRSLAEDMTCEQETSLIVQDEFLKLNLNPFVKFMDNHSAVTCLFTIRCIRELMTRYLHDQNIYEYKLAMETMERIELYFVSFLIPKQ